MTSINPISVLPSLQLSHGLGHLVLKTHPVGLSKGLGIFPGIGVNGSSKLLISGKALPDINNLDEPLTPIPGNIPSPLDRPTGCVFRTRCPNPCDNCRDGNTEMGLIEVKPGHWVDQCCINCS